MVAEYIAKIEGMHNELSTIPGYDGTN
ncbi:uncharacterized protein METZ01_LOCUS10148 [marine metagenome]|uniref:Uncharacterized protein n=1 Tax=marine metagenome TaxID=408172 RepID=A0A381NT52_9ZZZZ